MQQVHIIRLNLSKIWWTLKNMLSAFDRLVMCNLFLIQGI